MGTELTVYTQGDYSKLVISKALGVAQEQLRHSLEVYSESIIEAGVIRQYLEDNPYSRSTLQELSDAGRPPESYNLLLRISRLLGGYFKRVVTTAVGEAVTPEDTVTANLHNDNFKLSQRLSQWDSLMPRIIDDLLTTGLGAWQYQVESTGRSDYLGRPINNIKFAHINSIQVLPDPRAILPNKADAKYIHYWEYISSDDVLKEFGQERLTQLELSHAEHGDTSGYEVDVAYDTEVYNRLDQYEHWKDGNSYFVVRTYSKSDDGSIELLSWHGDIELGSQSLDVQVFPVQCIDSMRMASNNRYYSVLRGALASQDAINQALLQFQKLVGEERVIADNKAMREDQVPAFQQKLKTIGELLHVRNVNGIKVINLTRDAQAHLSKMYTSIQLILEVIGINEAFLGISKAGDSGRKFEGQKSSSENTLDYLFTPINTIHQEMYIGCMHYTSVYKQAEEQARFLDDFGQTRWTTINEPFFMPTGEVDEEGLPKVEAVKYEKYNKSNGKWEIAYVNEKAKSLEDIAIEVEVRSAPYDDTDAIEMAFLESMMNGQVGNIMANAHPAGVVHIYSLLSANLKTRNSEDISVYLKTLSKQLGALDIHDPRLYGNKSQGASGTGTPAGGQGGTGSQGKIEYAGGVQNDNQPEGYNKPTTQAEPNMNEGQNNV